MPTATPLPAPRRTAPLPPAVDAAPATLDLTLLERVHALLQRL